MHSFDHTLKAKLLKKINEQSNSVAERLVMGNWVGDKDMPRVGGEYLKQVGYLAALRDVVVLLAEVEKEINEG